MSGKARTAWILGTILSLAWGMPAQAQNAPGDQVGKGDDGAKIGTWAITVKTPKSKTPYRGTLVLMSRQGPKVQGFIRWADRRNGFELVAGGYQPDRRALMLEGVEWQGKGMGAELGHYEGLLTEGDRPEWKGAAALVRGGIPIGELYARFNDSTVVIPDDIKLALAPVTGLPEFYKNVSARVVVAGVNVWRKPDMQTLEEFAKNADPAIAGLAQIRCGLEKRRLEFEKTVFSILDSQHAQHDFFVGNSIARSLFDRGGYRFLNRKKVIEKLGEATEVMKLENKARDLLEAHLATRSVPKLAVDKDVTVKYEVEDKQDLILVLNNNTGKTLHNCVVVSETKVDQEKANTLQTRMQANAAAVADLAGLMGIPGNLDRWTAVEDAKFAFERVDKGSTVFIPEWKTGAPLKTVLSPLTTLLLAEASRVTIWSDDGSVAIEHLPLLKIKETANKALIRSTPKADPNGHLPKKGQMPKKVGNKK